MVIGLFDGFDRVSRFIRLRPTPQAPRHQRRGTRPRLQGQRLALKRMLRFGVWGWGFRVWGLGFGV